jgi:hypothetical protein
VSVWSYYRFREHNVKTKLPSCRRCQMRCISDELCTMNRTLGRAFKSSMSPRSTRSLIAVNRYTLNSSYRSVTSTAKPRRPSPYRLIPPHTFLASFAPLHVAGWRLVPIAPEPDATKIVRGAVEEGMADLQDRRLVRLYEFELGKQGWGDLMRFMRQVGEVVAVQDVSIASHLPS